MIYVEEELPVVSNKYGLWYPYPAKKGLSTKYLSIPNALTSWSILLSQAPQHVPVSYEG